jgi:DNA modification methylase
MILRGDARSIPLADGVVHCVVTSPPYWGLRDYGTPGQLGLERTPEEYVATMVEVFREVRRVLRDDGTCWLNLGDSYASTPPGNTTKGVSAKSTLHGVNGLSDRYRETLAQSVATKHNTIAPGLKPKDMVGIPWRVAFALQADGWWLRSDIIWSKPNPMPESVTDRPTKAHEYLFLLAKRERYYYDAEAIKEPAGEPRACGQNSRANVDRDPAHGTRKQDAIAKRTYTGFNERYFGGEQPAFRNRRTVWEIATQPYAEAHFATFPEALVEPCVLAGTSERGVCAGCGSPWERVVEKSGGTTGQSWHDHTNDLGRGQQKNENGLDTYRVKTKGWAPICACAVPTQPGIVLDPFAGSGTIGLVCHRLGRRFVGLELSDAYCQLAKKRTAQMGLV